MTVAREWTVYGLIDPRRPRAIRYIGITKDIRCRERTHRSDKGNNSGLMEWKQNLRVAGVELLAIPLETHRNLKAAQDAERYFIHDLRNQRTHGLLNIHDGGTWSPNAPRSLLTRARMSAAQKARCRPLPPVYKMSMVISQEGERLLALLAQKLGMSKSAVMRLGIQEMAQAEGIRTRGGL